MILELNETNRSLDWAFPVLLILTCLLVGAPTGHCADPEQETETALNADRLFKVEHVVEVSIEVDEADWDTLRHQGRSFTDALEKTQPPESPFVYVKADVTIDGVRLEGVGIRKKGFLGSLDEQRPSLKIKFSKFNPDYKTHPPITGIDRLTLNNNKQDPAGASHIIGYGLFRSVGVPASRCNAAHVTVNGEDLGIYSNVESVRRPFLRRTFGDDSGAHFEGTVADFYVDTITRFEPKNKAADHALLVAIAKALDGLDDDPADLETLGELVDIDSFVRYWATESLMGFWDGYSNDTNNFFLYRNPKDSKFYFLPWGVDCAFAEKMPIPPFIIRPQFVYNRSRLANRLYRIKETREKYLAEMNQLLEEHWDEDRLFAQLDDLEQRVGPLNTRGDEFDKSLASIRKFIKVRRRRLTREMENGFELTKSAKRPAYTKTVGRANATFDTKWYDEVPKETKELGKHELKLELDGEQIAFRQMGVYAQHSTWPPRPDSEPKPPTVVFHGNRKDGKEVIIGIGMPISKFKPTGDESIRVDGLLIEGKIGWPGTAYKPMGGTAKFTHAKMEDGASVIGSCELIAREIVDPKRETVSPIDQEPTAEE